MIPASKRDLWRLHDIRFSSTNKKKKKTFRLRGTFGCETMKLVSALYQHYPAIPGFLRRSCTHVPRIICLARLPVFCCTTIPCLLCILPIPKVTSAPPRFPGTAICLIIVRLSSSPLSAWRKDYEASVYSTDYNTGHLRDCWSYACGSRSLLYHRRVAGSF